MLKDASTDISQAQRWAQQEFGKAELGDSRRNDRLHELAACFLQEPTASIPKACRTWSATKAAYRFFSNSAVHSKDLIAPHLLQTQVRVAAQTRVVIVQDTTALNYGQRAGLGLVSNGPEGAKGLWVHSSMAFTETGEALGLVDVQCWQRDAKDFGKARRRQQRPLAEKESQKWSKSFEKCVELAQATPGVELINMADREADIYHLFGCAAAHPEVGVLVRARHNRPTEESCIDEQIQASAPAGVIPVRVPRRPGKRARVAELELRYAPVKVYRPRTTQDPLLLWVVDARECGSGPEAIHWRLITNRSTESLSEAIRWVQTYAVRWQIEEYHRVLKSGCQTEGRQLETASALLNVLMLDMVVAWRVLQLSRTARSSPEAPTREHFSPPELEILAACRGKGNKGPMTLREAVRAIAQMGGFLARASDGEPGAMTLWRGLEVLTNMVKGWELAKRYG